LVTPPEKLNVLNWIVPDPEAIWNNIIVFWISTTFVPNVNVGYRKYGVDDASKRTVFDDESTGGSVNVGTVFGDV
jgi:hypothetical protein